MYNMRNIKVIKKPLVRHMHIGRSFWKWCRIRKRDDRTVHQTNYILSSVVEHKYLLVIVSFTIASFYLGNQVFWVFLNKTMLQVTKFKYYNSLDPKDQSEIIVLSSTALAHLTWIFRTAQQSIFLVSSWESTANQRGQQLTELRKTRQKT